MSGPPNNSKENEMSLFSIPDDLLPGTMLDDVMKQADQLVPGEFANPVNFMAQPLAGAAAMSVLSVGLASHAIGVWFGTMTAATSASQRMFMPMFEGFALDVADFREAREKPRARTAEPELLVPPAKARAKKAKDAVTEAVEHPVMEEAAPQEPQLALDAPQAEPPVAAPEGAAVAPAAPAISDEPATEPQLFADEAPASEAGPAEVIATPAETQAVVEEAWAAAEEGVSVSPTVPAVEAVMEPSPEVATAPEPIVEAAPEPVAEAAPEPVAASEPFMEAAPEPPAEAVPEAKPAAPAFGLMPEDYRKPTAIARPEHPDDLKAITGIGPKLEKVLNDLGVWTYAQIAAWQRDEIAWIDDTLGFRGRIGRDGWLAQAAKFAAAKTEKSE